MLASIEDGHDENLVLTGLRGTGKTTLIREFEKVSEKNNFLVIKRGQFSKKHCDPEEFVNALKHDCRKIIEGISKSEKIKGNLKSAGNIIKPRAVGALGMVYYEPSYEKSDTPPFEDYVKDYLSKKLERF